MLRDKLKEFSKGDLIDAIMHLLEESTTIRGYRAYLNQVNNIVEFIENENLVDKISDKDDKKFDRGDKLFKGLPEQLDKIEKLQEKLLNIEEKVKVTEDGADNTIVSVIERYQSGKKGS